MKIIFTGFIFALLFVNAFGQASRQATGLIILEDNRILKHNFFLECKIDTTQTLQNNLANAKMHLLPRVVFSQSIKTPSEFAISAQIRISEITDMIKVIPAHIEFGTWSVRAKSIGEPDSILSPIFLNEKKISDGLQISKREMIMNLHPLKLHK